MRRIVIAAAILACLAAAAPATAARPVLSEAVLEITPEKPPQGQIEGACGLAVSGGTLYVSDYYHRVVDAFSLSSRGYVSQTTLPGGPFVGIGRNALDADCGLAAGPGGVLYANEWHQGVGRLLPSAMAIDVGHESTGVAADPGSGDVYVNDRTYVAVYEPSGAPVEVGGAPLRIGVGSLEDAYGVAVFEGRVYVPDAGSQTVKVFEPAGDPAVPVATISHGFTSLVDAAVAVDPTNGHLIVADNSQPGFEHPETALYEFEGSGAYLGQLACGPVAGGPSGLAFDPAGNLFVTNGNGEGSNVFEYGPYTAAAVPKPSCEKVALAGGRANLLNAVPAAPTTPGVDRVAAPATSPRAIRSVPAATASTVRQQRGLRVSFDGDIAPDRLPRHGVAGVRLSLSVKIAAIEGGALPALRRFSVAFNRVGRLHPGALPFCRLDRIQPATTSAARAACRRSLVGEGRFSAKVRLPEQSPFPSRGKVLAFNGRYHGRPAILAHVYGAKPIPTSYTLPLVLGRAKGTYGTELRASLPKVTAAAAVTGLKLTIGRSSSRRPYITAGCPAPAGFPGAVFPLARGKFVFAGGPHLFSTVSRGCEAHG